MEASNLVRDYRISLFIAAINAAFLLPLWLIFIQGRRKEMKIVNHDLNHPNASKLVGGLLLRVDNFSVGRVVLGRVLRAARAGTLTLRARALAGDGATVALGLAVTD